MKKKSLYKITYKRMMNGHVVRSPRIEYFELYYRVKGSYVN